MPINARTRPPKIGKFDTMTGHARFHTRIYGAIVLLGALAWAPLGHANPLDKSDMNSDGVVDTLDLAIFSDTFLQQDWQTVDWCAFHENSVTNERYFRKITSENTSSFERLLQFIKYYYYCQGQTDTTEKSDLNGDSIVDVEDLVIFSTNYLEMNWINVDWCLFYDSTVSGAEFNGRSTKYFLTHFELLLEFINDYYYCSGDPPPPVGLRLENTPSYLARITSTPYFDSDYYITDPVIGSLFIYDVDLVLKAEIKGNPLRLCGAMLAKGAFKALKEKGSYETYGGSPLLGVNGVVIIAHGSSSALAIRNAVRVAMETFSVKVNTRIEEAMANLATKEAAVE